MGNEQSKSKSEPKTFITPSDSVKKSKKSTQCDTYLANLLVFGFIRNVKKNIPNPIWHICYSYYLNLSFELHPKMTGTDYTFLKVVGKGLNGKMMQVRKNNTGKIYVLKVIKEQKLSKKANAHMIPFKRHILSNIDHPFIVSMRFAFQSKQKYYFIYDAFIGAELMRMSNGIKLACQRTKYYSAEICIALGHLHSIDIIFGDLCPQNVFLDIDGHIKITDFIYYKQCFHENENNICEITHLLNDETNYLAPEIFSSSITKSVDWWSFGMILYKMSTGFDICLTEMDNVNDVISKGTENVSKDIRSLLLGLLQKDPRKRLGTSKRDSLDIQEHSFFSSLDFDKLISKQLVPPFKPNSYFDEEPIMEPCDCCNYNGGNDDLVDKTDAMIAAKDMFTGFTYDDNYNQ
eukprot:237316_1